MNLLANRRYDEYQRALSSIFYKIFDKKTVSRMSVKKQPAEKLHKPLTKKFKRRNVYARFS